MSGLKRVLAFCLCLVLLAGFLPRETFAASSDATLVKKNGVWYYVKDGSMDSSYTGLCKYNNAWYYVKKGVLDWSYTGLCKYNNAWYYVKKGVLDWSYTGLCKYNNAWYYVKKGVLDWSYTGLCKYNNAWYYVKKGVLDWSYTGLCKYNNAWWYVVKGRLASDTTTLVKWNGQWWYIVKGKLASNTTTLVKWNGVWWYVIKGKVASNTTTLFTFNGRQYYILNGVAQTHYTGYVRYQGKQIYVYKGVVTTPPDPVPSLKKMLIDRYGTASQTTFVSAMGTDIRSYPSDLSGFVSLVPLKDRDGTVTEAFALRAVLRDDNRTAQIVGELYTHNGSQWSLRDSCTVYTMEFCDANNLYVFYSEPLESYCLMSEHYAWGSYTGVSYSGMAVYTLGSTIKLYASEFYDPFSSYPDYEGLLENLGAPYAKNCISYDKRNAATQFYPMCEVVHTVFGACDSYMTRNHKLQLKTQ